MQNQLKAGSGGETTPTQNQKRPNATESEMRGWINKWTNYIKGYQKRWFVLTGGILSYYRNQGEVGHTCRGSINLQGAFIHTEDSYKFIVSNGGTQTFHLKAQSEVDRQRWVTALELARVRAIKEAESDEEEEMKMDEQGQPEKGELQTSLKQLAVKLEDLTTCQDLIVKHGASLQKALAELEQNQTAPETTAARTKAVNERATLFRITTNAMLNACNEYVALAQTQGKKWQRLLQHEHDQRVLLQETVEQLARQHAALERATAVQNGQPPTLSLGDGIEAIYLGDARNERQSALVSTICSDDENEFHDALESVEHIPFFHSTSRKRRGSDASEGTSNGETEDNNSNTGADYCGAEYRTVSEGECQMLVEKNSRGGLTPVDSIVSTTRKSRRKTVRPKPNTSLSLWSIMKNCIGKELSRIPVPVNFNEPLSMLQRLTEDLEYSAILDRAARIQDSTEQMAYVAAFTVSSYSTTINRTGKPFNPLLFETYECDRSDDFGWRSITEQVSHHPPAAAMNVEGRGWTLWQEFTMSSKFRGKYLQIIPLGISHLEFKDSGNVYTWRKVVTTVHNIIVGKLWIDNHGDMMIENHKTGDKCHLKYIAYSYFSRDIPRKVTGVVQNSAGNVQWVLQGTWDDYIECAKVVNQPDESSGGKPIFDTLAPKTIWKKNQPLPGCDMFYNFTQLAIELNEPEEGVAPTDSRNRPDQRLHEEGNWDEANREKVRIEDKQRAARRIREKEAELAMQDGRPYKDLEPMWFVKQKDIWTGNLIHMFKGDYWDSKKKQEWAKCPDIF